MKKILIAVVLFASTCMFVQAQDIKIGHIDSDAVMQEMPEYQTALKELEDFRTELVNTLELMQVELNNKAETYNKEYNNYTDVVRQVKEQELNDANQRILEFQNQAQEQLQTKQNELYQPLLTKYQAAVDAAANKNGFVYVIEASALRYISPSKSTDIADLVKAELGIK